jgi:hypothetical protein
MDQHFELEFKREQKKEIPCWIGIRDWELTCATKASGSLVLACTRVTPAEYEQEVRITFRIKTGDDGKKYLQYKEFSGINLECSGYTYELMTVIERFARNALKSYEK